jgi:hypothetical protein
MEVCLSFDVLGCNSWCPQQKLLPFSAFNISWASRLWSKKSNESALVITEHTGSELSLQLFNFVLLAAIAMTLWNETVASATGRFWLASEGRRGRDKGLLCNAGRRKHLKPERDGHMKQISLAILFGEGFVSSTVVYFWRIRFPVFKCQAPFYLWWFGHLQAAPVVKNLEVGVCFDFRVQTSGHRDVFPHAIFYPGNSE